MPTPLTPSNRKDFRQSRLINRQGLAEVDFPTPNIEDLTIVEDYPVSAEIYEPLPRGTPHPTQPNSLLIGEKVMPGDGTAKKVRRVYATNPRYAQEPYNASDEFLEEASAYPIHIRRYTLLRPWTPAARDAPLKRVISLTITGGGSGYIGGTAPAPAVTIAAPISGTTATAIAQVQNGAVVALLLTLSGDGYVTAPTVTIAAPPSGVTATATAAIQITNEYLVSESAVTAEGDMGSLFDVVTRKYKTLPGPVIYTYENYGAGYLLRTDKQAVLPTAIPGEATGTVLRSEMQQTSTTEGVSTQTVIANADGTNASGWPIKTTSERDPESGAEVYTDHFIAPMGYQLPPTYTPPTTDIVSDVVTANNGGHLLGLFSPIAANLFGWTVTGTGVPSATTVVLQTGATIQISNAFTGTTTSSLSVNFLPPGLLQYYADWKQPNTNSIGYSGTSYTPPRYVVEAKSSEIEKSNNILVNVSYMARPFARIENVRASARFPAIFQINSVLVIPTNYAGQYRPPWPIGAGQPNGYDLIAHRDGVFPSRKSITYSVGITNALPEVYRVITPGVASKVLRGLIPPDCIHNAIYLGEEVVANSVTTTNIIENIPASTPSFYDSNELIFIEATERRWRGDIWIQEVIQASETTPLSAFPEPTISGLYTTSKTFKITPATGQFLIAKAFSSALVTVCASATPEVTIFGTYLLGTTPRSATESIVAVEGSLSSVLAANFTTHTFIRVIEVLIGSAVGDPVNVYAGFTPQTATIMMSGQVNSGDQLVIANGISTFVVAFGLNCSIAFDTATQSVFLAAAIGVSPIPNNSLVAASIPHSNDSSVNLTALDITDTGAGPSALTVTANGVPTGTIPVAAAILGAQSIAINSAGSGYTASSGTTVLTLPTPAGGVAGTVFSIFSGYVTSVSFANHGTGYTSVPAVTFGNPPVVSGSRVATGIAVVSAGSVASITITDPGAGYVTAPTLAITGGGGSSASANPVISVGLTLASISSNGSGYTSVPTATIGGGGTGASVTVSLGVFALNITSTGTNTYTVAPVVGFSGGSPTVNASAVIALTAGVITGYTIPNSGSGFTSVPTATFRGGPILSVSLSSGGSGYTSATTIIFPGGNGLATASPFITGGVIQLITLNNAGNWYTSGAMIITDSGGGTGAAGTFVADNTNQTGYVRAPWCTFDPANGEFYPGQGGALIATVPAGATMAFAFPGGGLPALSNATTPNCPAAIVLYTDWLQFLPGVDLHVSYEVAGTPPVRIAYQLSGTPTTPATVTVTGQTYTNGSLTVGGTAFLSGYFGCAVLVGNDPQENEVVNGTTLLRPYEGSAGTSSVVTPLAATLLNAGAGNSTPYIADLGTQSGPFVRLKITQPSNNLQYRSIEAKATWTVFP